MHGDAFDGPGDGFEVDAARLASRAGQFEPLVSRLDSIQRNLTDALSADGACWGTDAVGQSFNAVHAAPADDALARLSGLSGRLTSVSTRLTETAGTYRTVDRSAAEHLKSAER
ncbi:WXG100 family type VII secretion target [Actinophytocola sp.]|uniref:WXG100 family type VII secretion target n=1 Tax=Actinophytocola sp. TaxID=1872138 RepID=UPI003899E1C4